MMKHVSPGVDSLRNLSFVMRRVPKPGLGTRRKFLFAKLIFLTASTRPANDQLCGQQH